ncbi:DUF3303 family protein [Jannaschia rubra]|uniref:Uncharacterized protein n=1 Tax=Jannaschia rubra TaxID=282197 RepID=A0A0M6XJU1_9RHOB|nr:DUF3303 family protein [Jannaschia rubra]CTQ31369.1 hypothetical protein JAN5088_00125 [Jannaschia rubra]SFF80852.1 hypothetical protein SAMN04488517_101292 [Jannaschia rubra]
MNLLLHQTPASYDDWKRDFDAHTETRMNAGLTLLQLWRDLDGSGVTALFQVNDRKKAQDWLDRETQTGGPLDARFMRTA